MTENNSLYQTFINNNITEIETILFSDNTKELINTTFEDDENILHLAAKYGYDKLIPRIIELGIDQDSIDNKGKTPLHYAAKNGKIEVVRTLLQHNADVHSQDNKERTPLHYAINKEIVMILIEHGADVNAEQENGKTPLHYAVLNDNKETVITLIEHGTDVNAEENNGEAPLHYARSEETVTALIEGGANVYSTTARKETILHTAALYGNIKVISTFIRHGIDVNSKTDNGRTPLHYAAKNGNVPTIMILINNGASINMHDSSGNTSIKIAINNNHQEAVETLKTGLLIDKLYTATLDPKTNYEDQDVIKYLPRLECLIKTKGLPPHLLNENNIPEPIRDEVIKLIKPFKNIDQNIQNAVEVNLAAILNRLYPDQFPTPLPYSKALEHKDSKTDRNICKALLKSYEQHPEFKPVNLFNEMINSINRQTRQTVIDALISCYSDVKYMLIHLDGTVLTQTQRKNFVAFKEVFNSSRTKDRALDNFNDIINIQQGALQQSEEKIKILQNEHTKLQKDIENLQDDQKKLQEQMTQLLQAIPNPKRLPEQTFKFAKREDERTKIPKAQERS
ncbi:Ankyrin repeat protein [Rickettsiales bacterium Ac37b]|nr:Ankyrin repeat protein [Rickettsiales bacterium Ac37b]